MQVSSAYADAMTDRNSRIVYSTATRGICPKCGWPQRDCKCSSQFQRDAALPARIVVKLRLEKKGRAGKTVTVVYGLPDNQPCGRVPGEVTAECNRQIWSPESRACCTPGVWPRAALS